MFPMQSIDLRANLIGWICVQNYAQEGINASHSCLTKKPNNADIRPYLTPKLAKAIKQLKSKEHHCTSNCHL